LEAKGLNESGCDDQVRECDENYLKSCYIAYEKAAKKVPLKICRKPLVKDCSSAKVKGDNWITVSRELNFKSLAEVV